MACGGAEGKAGPLGGGKAVEQEEQALQSTEGGTQIHCGWLAAPPSQIAQRTKNQPASTQGKRDSDQGPDRPTTLDPSPLSLLPHVYNAAAAAAAPENSSTWAAGQAHRRPSALWVSERERESV